MSLRARVTIHISELLCLMQGSSPVQRLHKLFILRASLQESNFPLLIDCSGIELFRCKFLVWWKFLSKFKECQRRCFLVDLEDDIEGFFGHVVVAGIDAELKLGIFRPWWDNAASRHCRCSELWCHFGQCENLFFEHVEDFGHFWSEKRNDSQKRRNFEQVSLELVNLLERSYEQKRITADVSYNVTLGRRVISTYTLSFKATLGRDIKFSHFVRNDFRIFRKSYCWMDTNRKDRKSEKEEE